MAEFRHLTDRLILRDWGEGDLARFAQATNTPEVMRWLGGVMDAEKLAALEGRYRAYREQYGHTFWIVERQADGGHLSAEVLGMCGLKRIDAPGAGFPGEMEIGWRLREDAWGHGYAREAAAAALAIGFDTFAAQEIFALTIKENAASWGLMKRLGMARRADLDFTDDRYVAPLDATIVHAISRDTWQSTQL